MTTQIILICAFVVSFCVALYLSRKEGSKAAQLEALKAELKKQAEEQVRANRITDRVSSLSNEEARRKLNEIANKIRKKV